jgi:hypothetical protein
VGKTSFLVKMTTKSVCEVQAEVRRKAQLMQQTGDMRPIAVDSSHDQLVAGFIQKFKRMMQGSHHPGS